MLLRGLRVVLTAALVVLLAAGESSRPGSGPAAATKRTEVVDTTAVAATQTVRQPRQKRFQCDGVEHREVKGPGPAYTRKKLVVHRNHKRVCHATWIPKPRKRFVPQGLAVAGSTAWMTGFLYSEGYGERPCRLLRIDVRTGRQLSRQGIVGRVGTRPATYCRHGGGVLKRGKWLWIVEKNRLWRVDSTIRSRTIRATRVWRLESPVRGSTVVATSKLLGIVPFQESGRPRIHWFPFRALHREGVLELARRDKGRKQLGAAVRTRIPTHVQGATLDSEGDLYLARSNLKCGELVTPRRRIAIVPGAEGIDLTSRRLWVASESGSRPYAEGTRKPLTAGVTAFEWPGLQLARRSLCRF
ncbi:MAG TPA: hypothetical protein VFJ28_10545 [Marmoricola sp.]|nr:hypothetical protein [Marmoricola sp.]